MMIKNFLFKMNYKTSITNFNKYVKKPLFFITHIDLLINYR